MDDVISRGVKQKLGNKKLDKGLNKNFFSLDSMNPDPIWRGDVCHQARPGEGLLIIFPGMAPYILLIKRQNFFGILRICLDAL